MIYDHVRVKKGISQTESQFAAKHLPTPDTPTVRELVIALYAIYSTATRAGFFAVS
jgi:hypothetical protein